MLSYDNTLCNAWRKSHHIISRFVSFVDANRQLEQFKVWQQVNAADLSVHHGKTRKNGNSTPVGLTGASNESKSAEPSSFSLHFIKL